MFEKFKGLKVKILGGEMTKKGLTLFMVLAVLLMGISVLPGCNKEPPVEADELVIPSSMSPYEVFGKIASTDPQIKTWPFWQGVWTAEYIDPYGMPEGASEEQFIIAFSARLAEAFYTKRDGKRAGYGLYEPVLRIVILKYEDTESAERSFVNISETQELQDSTYGGIALKNGIHTLTWWEEESKDWDESTMPCYLIHSNCFIIYFFGREDITKDILDRIIVSFGVNGQEVGGMKLRTSADSTVLATSSGVEDNANMSIGTEVVLNKNTIATYLGKTSEGNYKWQATFGGPKYLDDLVTPISCRWSCDTDKGEWHSDANLFNATVKGDKVTVEYQGVKMHWQPQLKIGSKQQVEGLANLLPVDPINENYLTNTLQWDYGNGITRNLRIIEGMLIEYYIISEPLTVDLTIKTNVNKDAGFVWTRPEVAWDANYMPVDLIVDGDDLTLTLEAMQNATFPITIDPDTTFTTSSSDGCLDFYPAVSYEVARESPTATHIYDSTSWATIGQLYEYGKFFVGRSFVYFPTAGLPEDIVNITSVTLRLAGLDDCSHQDFYIQIQSGMPTYPHDPMTEADYNKNHYSGNGGQLSTVDFVVGSYNEIELTSEGRSWINTEGWTKFCLRSSRDINPFNTPTGSESVEVHPYESSMGYHPELVVTYETPPPPPPLLEKYTPILYFHPYENYYTDSINSMLEESDLWRLDGGGRTNVTSTPTIDDLVSHNTNQYYTDMRDSEPGYGMVFSNGFFIPFSGTTPPDPSRFFDYPYAVYGRQVEKSHQGSDYIILQYWFFYPYNRWWNCHEGDMERVQIILDKATETPQRVTFGQHWGGQTVTWNEVSLVAETHPKVFVGVGSHSSWPTDGDHVIATFLHDIVTLTDYTSDEGTALFPACLSSAWNSYTLTDISNEPSWVDWLGTWGYFVPGDMNGWGRSGAPSPANVWIVYNWTTGERVNIWDDPIGWADRPSPDWYIIISTNSRLDVYDSRGNHNGLNETGGIETEIPGTYFYIPASNQSEEIMWIYTSENLTFITEASEVGESNFSFARCSDGKITTDYTHVEVIKNTTATVDTNQTPIPVMQIDFDGDGRFDKSKLPDDAGNSTFIGKVSFPMRGDPPNDRWIEPFAVRFFEPSTHNELSWSPLYATTNSSGYFTITGLPAGTYDIGIKSWTTLSKLAYGVTLNGS